MDLDRLQSLKMALFSLLTCLANEIQEEEVVICYHNLNMTTDKRN